MQSLMIWNFALCCLIVLFIFSNLSWIFSIICLINSRYVGHPHIYIHTHTFIYVHTPARLRTKEEATTPHLYTWSQPPTQTQSVQTPWNSVGILYMQKILINCCIKRIWFIYDLHHTVLCLRVYVQLDIQKASYILITYIKDRVWVVHKTVIFFSGKTVRSS